MNAERDYLVKFIFPRLTDYCNSKHLEFVPIDLRWGIPEEDSRNGLVLSACLEEVDNSRPFFIGILGSRYGWAPAQSDLNMLPSSLERIRPWLQDKIRSSCSITEMEIEYGVLRDMKIPHAAFYIRDEHVEIPADHREEYGSVAQKKLESLKQRIRRQGQYPVKDYTTPEDLGQMIYDRVVEMINAEYPLKTDDEYDSVVGIHRYVLENNGHSFINTEYLWDLFERHINERTKLLFMCNSSGTENLHSLAVVINQLNKKYQNVHYFDFEYAPDDVALIAAFEHWANLEIKLTDEPAWHYVAIDNCSLLNIEESRQLSDWIKKQPEYTYIAVAGSYRSPIYSTLYWRFSPKEINYYGLAPDDKRSYIDNYTRYYGKRLTSQQLDIICSGKSTNDSSVLQLICQELVSFGSMEGLDDRIKVLTEKQQYGNIVPTLFIEVRELFKKYNLVDAFAKATTAISLVEGGIPENDIIEICSISQAEWSTIRPYVLRFCKKCGSRISYIYEGWWRYVMELWPTPFRAEMAYDILIYYLLQLFDIEKPNIEAVRKLFTPLFNFIMLPHDEHKYDDLLDNIHSICLSPEIVKYIPASEYTPLWMLISNNHRRRLRMSDTPIKIWGKHIEELSYEETILFYERLAYTAENIGLVDDAVWVYERIAQYKLNKGEEDSVLSSVRGLLVQGKIHKALDVLDNFERAVSKRNWFGKKYTCSGDTLLKLAICRAKANVAIGRYRDAAKGLFNTLKQVSVATISVAEAQSLLRCIATENYLDDKYMNVGIGKIPNHILEQPLTSQILSQFIKANMLVCLNRLKDYKKAVYWAEWHLTVAEYSIGTGMVNWPVTIMNAVPTVYSQALIYLAYAQVMQYGEQNILVHAYIGKLLPIKYKRSFPKDYPVNKLDLDYRHTLYAEAKRFRYMLIEIEKAEYKQYDKTMPQKQYDEEIAELESYRKSLLL